MSPRHRTAPFLPFLDGPADFKPKLSPITSSDWLLPDTEAAAWLTEKRLLMKLQRARVSGGARDSAAAEEVLKMIMQTTDQSPKQAMPTALEEAASLVSDDLCLLQAEHPHKWQLTAGVLCAPTYWTLPERIGMDLSHLHLPVTQGDRTLARRIGRVFSGLHPGHILQRFNWTVQTGAERFTPTRPQVLGCGPQDLHLRVERQTLRKLPRTGAILFTIRVCVDPLLPILAHPAQCEAFEDAWLQTAPNVRAYKAWPELEPLVAEACRTAARASIPR